MKKINLCSLENSDVKYRIDRFPDGEVQFVLTEELNRKEEYTLYCRITNAEELFVVLQAGDILDRQGVIWDLHITYLMGMRMDRVMSFERPFTLRIVAKQISSMGYQKCFIETAHSVRTMMEIRDSVSMEYNPYHFLMDKEIENACVVYPDHGALERYEGTETSEVVYFIKERDIETGKIKSFELHDNNIANKDFFLFYDDLCDAGGTFLGELAVLKEKYPNAKFAIRVTHLVNEKGLDNLCQNFDTVYITNSYKEWGQIAIEKGYTNLIVD